jgi:hypothetical protein
MMLKKPRHQIAQDAQQRAFSALTIHMGNIGYNLSNNSPSSILYQLQTAIGNAIGEAIEEVLDNVYTDQEFEHDTTLDQP